MSVNQNYPLIIIKKKTRSPKKADFPSPATVGGGEGRSERAAGVATGTVAGKISIYADLGMTPCINKFAYGKLTYLLAG